MSSIKEIVDAYQKQRQSLMEQHKALFHQVVATMFEKHPQIKTIYWAGYTPYFNDGDTCEFTVHDVHFSPVELDEIDGPYYGEEVEDESMADFGTYNSVHRVSDEMKADMKAFSEFMEQSADVLLDLFEDHHFVRVSKDRTVREDYDHD